MLNKMLNQTLISTGITQITLAFQLRRAYPGCVERCVDRGKKLLMQPVFMIAACTCAGMLLAIALLFRKLSSPGSSLPVTAEWIEALSLEQYRPMMRLLDGQDLEFLRGQPGFTPAMEVRLRVQRCRVFAAICIASTPISAVSVRP